MSTSELENVALLADSQRNLVIRTIEVPQPGPKQVVVQVTHVAQNPTDGESIVFSLIGTAWSENVTVQSFDSAAFGDDSVYGCDFAGKVVVLGERVTKLAVGDVVAGLVWGGKVSTSDGE
jgi:NADPH:quinone reductase-like Zn-dependent oxidoreductase